MRDRYLEPTRPNVPAKATRIEVDRRRRRWVVRNVAHVFAALYSRGGLADYDSAIRMAEGLAERLYPYPVQP
jgi:hypothetical protein